MTGARRRLLLATVVIAGVWQVPHGPTLLYPLTLLATYAHELGHGITAILVGAEFDSLQLFADGSGLARWHGSPGRIGRALIAAGGLVGPSLAAVLLLVLARSPRHARWLLAAAAVLLGVSVVLWVRNVFGIAFVLAVAVFFLAASRLLAGTAAAFVLQFIAAVLCLSWVRDVDYMFSGSAMAGGVLRASDSAQIAAALGLPYWFWGAIVAAVSLALLAFGLWATGGKTSS